MHEYSFGTNLIYKIETGKPRETKVETGTYTLAPITGTPNSYTLALRPYNGIPYTITASEVTGITAISSNHPRSNGNSAFKKIIP